MIACAAAFAAGILLPPSQDRLAENSEPEITRVASLEPIPSE